MVAARRTPIQDVLSAAEIVKQKAVIEYRDEDGPEWWLMLPDGSVEVLDTAGAALRAVRKHDRAILNMTRTPAAIVTTVEWRNVPDGWTPPK